MPSSKLLLVALLVFFNCLGAEVDASLGINSPVLISEGQFTALKGQGYVNFIGQYYNGAIVTNPNSMAGLYKGVNFDGIHSIANADAVLTTSNRIDAYHVPVYAAPVNFYYCYPYNLALYWCKIFGPGIHSNVYAQARVPIDYMNANGGYIGRTYVVISQSANSRWSANQAANVAFLTEFLSYFPVPFGPQAGIISNQADFQTIFGTNYTPKDSNGNPVELLWTSCDGNPDLNSPPFTPFNDDGIGANGWNTLQVKQYQCGVTNIGGQTGVNGDLVSHV